MREGMQCVCLGEWVCVHTYVESFQCGQKRVLLSGNDDLCVMVCACLMDGRRACSARVGVRAYVGCVFS